MHELKVFPRFFIVLGETVQFSIEILIYNINLYASYSSEYSCSTHTFWLVHVSQNALTKRYVLK